MDNKSGKVRTETYSGVFVRGQRIASRFKPTQEKWLKLQDLILRLKSKHVLTARCLMSLIGLLVSTEKMVLEGRLHRRPFQFHLKEHWRYPQSLDSLLPWTRLVAESCKHDERLRPSSQRPQYPALYRRLKRRLGRSLRSKFYKGSVVKPKLHPKDHSIQLFIGASNEGWGAHLDQTRKKGYT